MPEPSPRPASLAGFPARFQAILISPGRAFAEILTRPGSWWQPVVLMTGVAALKLALIFDRVLEPAYLEDLARDGTGAATIAGAGDLIRVATWLGLLLVPLQAIVLGAVVYWLGLLLGGVATFVQSLAVAAYGLLIGVVEALVRTPLILARGSPEVFLGPAVLMPAELSQSFFFRVATHLDVFTLWKVAVIGIGMAGAHRLPIGRALGVLGAAWGIWVLGSVLLGGLAGAPR